MSVEFRMPSLGADMREGTLVEWRVAPGSEIKRGQVVALVETDKGIIDVEAFRDATVERLVVDPGTRVPVGAVLALLVGEGAAPAAPAAPVTPTAPRSRASPAARARAQALGVDLAGIAGTGPGGAITIGDVERAAQPGPPPSARAAEAPRGMRQAIAAAMSRSKREIPHYYLAATVDFEPARRWLDARNAALAVEDRLLAAVLFVKSVALAAKELPGFAGFYRDGRFEPVATVDVGVAVARRDGLIAPALFDPASKPLPAIMTELRDLVTRVRTGRLRSLELSAPAITVSSLGEEGVDVMYPIIYPDQVAIVGVGGIVQRPWVIDGGVAPRTTVTLTLAADHRVTDGRRGARFLARIYELLRSPETLQ